MNTKVLYKIAFFVLLTFAGVIASAQTRMSSPFFKKGITGYASMGGAALVTRGTEGSEIAPSASIGYGFGEGTYLGTGTSCYFHSGNDWTVPIFVEMKHSFTKNNVISPFADVKSGFVFTKPHGHGLLICPGVGVNVSRFFMECSFSYDSGEINTQGEKYNYKRELILMSFGIAF
ncbi:MAG: hypothetical protein LKI59_09090 [Bacteroidales bacterium]|jgi:hypothetical protein|nr:hypothetical protein [Bacteroidales bacterium]